MSKTVAVDSVASNQDAPFPPPSLPPAEQQVEVGRLAIETEQEEDGRWIAEIPKLVGVMDYGTTRKEAIA